MLKNLALITEKTLRLNSPIFILDGVYEHSQKDDGFYWGSAAFVLGVMGAVGAVIVSLSVIDYLSDRTNGKETLLYESFVNDEIMYAKRDFSKFDN